MGWPWMNIAWGEFGTGEIAGSRHNTRILEYHATTTLGAKDDETSWCSAFVNWVILEVGLQGTNAANARSWLDWGAERATWQPGDVCVIWRESPSSWKGHVGFLLHADHNWVYLLGGNQGDRVSVARYPRDRVLGYRYPGGGV